MIFNPLYHWAPASRYELIRRHGLRPSSAPTVASGQLDYLCLSPDPRRGWEISGAMGFVADIDEWDLWHVYLVDGDRVSIRPELGPVINEVTVAGPIPTSRIWHVGRRRTDDLVAGVSGT